MSMPTWANDDAPSTLPHEPAEPCTDLGADDDRDPMHLDDLGLLVVIMVGSIATVALIAWGIATWLG